MLGAKAGSGSRIGYQMVLFAWYKCLDLQAHILSRRLAWFVYVIFFSWLLEQPGFMCPGIHFAQYCRC